MNQFTNVVLVILISFCLLFAGCDKSQQYADALPAPKITEFPKDIRKDDKAALTYVYWNNMHNIISPLFELDVEVPFAHNDGGMPKDAGPLVYRKIVRQLNDLPAQGVDEDVIKVQSEIVKAFTDAAEYFQWKDSFTFIVDTADKDDLTSGVKKVNEKIATLTKIFRDTQIESMKVRNIVSSRYTKYEFKQIKLH